MRGQEQFAGEGTFGRPATQGFRRANCGCVRIVILLRNMGEDKIAGGRVETIGIGQEFADGMIRKMAGAGKDALLDDPGIGADLEHVEVVIGFENEAIGFAEVHAHVVGQIAEVGADGNFCSIGAKGEGHGIGGIVRDRKRVHIDIANDEALPGVDGFDAAKTFAESVGEDALQRVHGGFGDIERSFPEAENLREAVAVVGVLVSDEDGVEAIDVAFDGSKAGEGFAFSEAGVNEDAGAFGFEQGQVARTTGGQNGDAQADWNSPGETLKIMAERKECVNAQKAANVDNSCGV